MKAQMNLLIPADLAKRVDLDVVRHNVSKSEYVAKILEAFLSRPVESRRASMSTLSPKRMGRRVVSAARN